jgi:hypothetical protein
MWTEASGRKTRRFGAAGYTTVDDAERLEQPHRVKRSTSLCVVLSAVALGTCGCGSSGSEDGDGGGSPSGGAIQLSGGAGGASETGGTSASGGGTKNGGSGGSAANSSGGTSTSGGSSSSGGPNLPNSTRLVDLDPSEKATLCDWYASKLGGYGHVTQCPMGPLQVYVDQAQCVSVGLDYRCPPITVANLVECVEAQVPSGGCNKPDAQCHWLSCH